MDMLTPAGATIASWIVLDKKEEETEFPSAGRHSSSREFQLIYWRCALVCFGTSVRQNPNAHHVIFSNVDIAAHAPAEVVDRLRSWDVELVTLEFKHRLPLGSVQRWGNVFYELDILRYVHEQQWPGLILLDIDCVWIRPSSEIEAALNQKDILAYTLNPEDQKNYEGDVLINGMSRKAMRADIEPRLGRAMDRDPYIYGGEFFAVTAAACGLLVRDTEALWNQVLAKLHLQDSMKTEEHLLSILFEVNGAEPHSGNRFVRRMWTHFEDFNVKPSDLMLTIWHLPAEKRFGFRTLYSELLDPRSQFWTGTPEEAVAVIRRHMGVPRKSPIKFSRDLLQRLADRVQQRLPIRQLLAAMQ